MLLDAVNDKDNSSNFIINHAKSVTITLDYVTSITKLPLPSCCELIIYIEQIIKNMYSGH